MADKQGRIEVDAVVSDALDAALKGMSGNLRNVINSINAVTKSASANENTFDSLNRVLKAGENANTSYARSVARLSKDQIILASHFRAVRSAADALENQMKNGTNSVAGYDTASQKLLTTLRQQEKTQRSLSRFVLKQDFQRQAASLTELSNKYSQAGNRLSMSLTVPIIGFARASFSSYKRLEVETVRTRKLLSDSFTDITATMKVLGKELDGITYKYGISRELVQGIAGDFAELGINSIEAIAGLTDLTAATEKLGNVDIAESQQFIKSIYQTILRIKRDQGILTETPQDYADAIAEVTGQLAMFNLVENKTALSLKEIAKGFPEMGAAATSFGLTMTEATALLAPMVSSGFQLGAAANSIKVSLQRIVDMPKANQTMLSQLNMDMNDFNLSAGIGIHTIQKFADGFNKLKSTKGEQGTLEFFAKMFGVRQGSRMLIGFQNLAQFQEQLQTNGTVEKDLANLLETYVRKQTKNLAPEYSKIQIKKFEDLSKVVRLTQSKDKKVADAFIKGRDEFATYLSDQAKSGNDLISKVQTESGRAMLIAAAGGGANSEAARKFMQEVEASLNTTEVKYQRAREMFKAIGRELVPTFAQLLSAVNPILNVVTSILEKMSPASKMFISFGVIFLALIGPLMKMRGAFYQMRSAIASMRAKSPFSGWRKEMIPVSEELIRSNDLLFKLKGKLTQQGNNFFLNATRKEFEQLQKAMTLDATGGFFGKRKAKKIKESLGITDKTQADFSGLYPAMAESVKRSLSGEIAGQELIDAQRNILGQYAQVFTDAGGQITAKIMEESTAIGRGIAEEMLAVLAQFGFDPASVVPKIAPQKQGNVKAGKPGTQPPPPAGGQPPAGPTGGQPAGPAGGQPAGGLPPATLAPVTSPATTTPATSTGSKPAIQPRKSGPRTRILNPQELYDIAMNPLIDGLEKISVADLKEMLKLRGFSSSSFAGMNPKQLKKKLMDHFEANGAALVKSLADYLNDVAGKATNVVKPKKARGPSTKTGDASAQATTDVADAQEEVDTETVIDQGKSDTDAVEDNKKKSGKGSGKTKKASKKAADDVAEAQDDLNTRAVKKDTDRVLEEIKGTPYNPTEVATGFAETIKIRLKALEDALTPVRESLDLASVEKIDVPNIGLDGVVSAWDMFQESLLDPLEKEKNQLSQAAKDLYPQLQTVSAGLIAQTLTSFKETFEIPTQFFTNLEEIFKKVPSMRGLTLGKKSNAKTKQIEEQISDVQTELKRTREKLIRNRERLSQEEVDATEAQINDMQNALLILRESLQTEQGKIKNSAQKALTTLNTKLRSIQSKPITAESISEIVQAFNEIAGLTKADFSEVIDILIVQLKDSKKQIGQKIQAGAIPKEKGQADIRGINAFIKELEKTKETITDLSKDIDEQVGGRLSNIRGRLGRIRNRLIGTVFPDYGSVTGGEVERYATDEEDQAFQDDIGSIGGLLDEIINNELQSRQKIEDGVIKSVVFNQAEEINKLEQLNEDLIDVNSAITSVLEKIDAENQKKPYPAQADKLKDLSGQLEKLTEKKQALEHQLSESLEEDFGRGGKSVLNQVKDLQDRIQSLKSQIDTAKQSVVEQNQKIANIKTNKETFVSESVAKQQANLIEATAQAQKYSQENAQLIADKVAEMQIAREALYSATQEYTQEEIKNDQELARELNIVENKIRGTVRLIQSRSDGVHTEHLHEEFKQLSEEKARLEKEYAKTSDKRLGIQQKQQQVQMLEEEVRSMTAQATAPVPVSEEEMFTKAKAEYAAMLRQEEGIVTTLNAQIAGFSSELHFATEKELGFLQRLKTALGSISGILPISTPEGYEAEIERLKQQRSEQIAIRREAERIQKEALDSIRRKNLGDLENPTQSTIGDIRTEAALQLKNEKEINDRIKRSKREQDKKQTALASATDVAEIEALQEEINNLEISISNNMSKLTIIDEVKKNLAALARQLYSVEIFTNSTNKTLSTINVEEGIAPIANQVSVVKANLDSVIGQDLDKVFGTTFEDLRKLGFDISNVKGQMLKPGQLRLTGTVFKNISEKLGIILPPVFEELSDLLTQTDIVFQDTDRAFMFVKGILEKIDVGTSRNDTIGKDLEYGALESLLNFDKIAKLLDLSSKYLKIKNFGLDSKTTSKLKNLFIAASGKVLEARKKRSNAAQSEVDGAIASVSDNAQISISVMDEFEGHITDFFLNRLRMMRDVLFSNELLLAKQKIQSGRDTKSQSIAQKQSQKEKYLTEINELIKKGPEENKARIESLKESVRIINADIAKLEQAKEIHIAQIDKTIEDINNSIRDRVRGIRGAADVLRRKLGLSKIVRRGGVPVSEDVGGVSIREALATGQISQEEYIARKSPNENLFIRPRVITPEASAARKKILERIKQSLDNYKVADQHNKERIAGLIDKDIADSRTIISDFMAEKDSIFGSMLLGFRIQMQAISDIPKELRTNFDNLRLQGFETAIQDAKGLLNRLLRAGFSEEEATKAAERYMSRIAAGLMEFHELIQVDFDAYFARLEQDSIAAIEADQSLIGAAFKYVNPLEFLNRSGIVERLKSLSAAANPFMNTGDILDRNIIEHMLTILLEQFGKTGEEIKKFVQAFNSTLIGSRARLVTISKATIGDIQDEIPALITSFEKLGITLQEALSDPARTMALIKDNADFKNIAKKDDLVELFRTLILFARDAADKSVEQVIEQTIGRIRTSSSSAGSGGAPAGKPSFFNALSKVTGNEESKSFIESNLTLDLLKEIQITPEELKNLLNVKQLQYLAQAIGGLTRQQSGKTKDEVISNVIKLIKDVQDGVITELHAVSRPSDGSKGKAREAAKETKKKIKEEEKKLAEEAKATVEDAKTTTTPSKTTLQRVMEHPMLAESPIESMKKIISMKNRLLIPLEKQNRASLLYLKELVENISEDGTFIDLLLEKYGINLSEFIVQIRAEIEKTVQEDRVKTKKVISDYRSQMHGPFLSEVPRPSFGSIAEQRAANAEKYSSRGVSLEKSSLSPLVSELNTGIGEPITEVKTNIDEMVQLVIRLMGHIRKMTKDQLQDMIMMLGNMPTDLTSALESMGMQIEPMIEKITKEMARDGRELGFNINEKFNDWFNRIIQSVKKAAIDEANVVELTPIGPAIAKTFDDIILDIKHVGIGRFSGNLADFVMGFTDLVVNLNNLTEDQLLKLQNEIRLILNDPTTITKFTDQFGIDLESLFEEIEKAIAKLRNTAHAVATSATASATSAGAGAGGGSGNIPPAGGPPTGGNPPNPPSGGLTPSLVNPSIFGPSFGKGIFSNFSLIRSGLVTASLGILKFEQSIIKATLGLVPFGKTTYKALAGIGQTLQYLGKTIKEADEAGHIFSGTIKTIKKDIGTAFIGKMKKFGDGAKQVFGGIRGSMKGQLGMGLGQAINMSTMNMGMAGMIGGNMLENLVRGIQQIPIIGGPAILIITALSGGIALLSKTTKLWGSNNKKTLDNFHQAWVNIKSIFAALIPPIEDFFGVLLGGTKTTKTGVEKAQSSLQGFSSWLKNFTATVVTFMQSKVAPALRYVLGVITYMYQAITPVITTLFKAIGLQVVAWKNQNAGAIDATSAKWGKFRREAEDAAKAGALAQKSSAENSSKAWSDFWEAFKNFGGDLVDLWRNVIAVIQIRLVQWVNQGIVFIAKTIVDIFIEAGADAGSWFIRNFLKMMPTTGLLGKLFKKILGVNPIDKIQFDWLKNTAKDANKSFWNGVSDGIGKGSDAILKILNGKTKDAFNNMIKNLIPQGAGKGLGNAFINLVKEAFKNPAAADAAGSALADMKQKIKQGIKDLQSSFVNEAINQIGIAMGRMKDDINAQLSIQKEDFLKAYDDQIAAINDLADAEQQLTATEQYESDKRKRIKDRELQQQNYAKERAIAIYEGRVDDARNLDLEEKKNSQAFSEDIANLDKDRNLSLQAQNRAAAIKTIENQKAAASKIFEAAIKEFEDYYAEVTKNGTLSEEAMKDQWEKISKKAIDVSDNMATAFKTSFAALPALIQSGMDPISAPSGFFSVGIDRLIETAKKKFGLDSFTTTENATSLLGVTASLLGSAGFKGQIETAFADGGPIQSAYGKGHDALVAYVQEKNDESKPDSLKNVFKKAMADANDAMEAEFKKNNMVGSIKNLVKEMNGEWSKLAIAKITKDAMAEAANTIKNTMNDINKGTTGKGDQGLEATVVRAWVPISETQYRSMINGKDKNKYEFKTANDRYFYRSQFFMNGGAIPYAQGGPTFGPMHQGIPAVLHGGEYVVRKSAVDKYGSGMLQSINQGTYNKTKGFFNGGMIPYAKGGVVKEMSRQIGQKFGTKESAALNEWQSQMAAGYANEEYWNAVGKAETGVDSSGRAPRWRRKNKFGGGGLGISQAAWFDYGGNDFAKRPDLATAIQQMVIANRIGFAGHTKTWPAGSSEFPAGMTKNLPASLNGWGVITNGSVPRPENFKTSTWATALGHVSKFIGGLIGYAKGGQVTPEKFDQEKLPLMGKLQIPKRGVFGDVYDSLSEKAFNSGFGHWPNTAWGGIGNTVIGGHRSKGWAPFRNIDKFQIGDAVNLFNDKGLLNSYQIFKKSIVNPEDTWIAQQSVKDALLTMFACHPYGKTSQRYVVWAKQIKKFFNGGLIPGYKKGGSVPKEFGPSQYYPITSDMLAALVPLATERNDGEYDKSDLLQQANFDLIRGVNEYLHNNINSLRYMSKKDWKSYKYEDPYTDLDIITPSFSDISQKDIGYSQVDNNFTLALGKISKLKNYVPIKPAPHGFFEYTESELLKDNAINYPLLQLKNNTTPDIISKYISIIYKEIQKAVAVDKYRHYFSKKTHGGKNVFNSEDFLPSPSETVDYISTGTGKIDYKYLDFMKKDHSGIVNSLIINWLGGKNPTMLGEDLVETPKNKYIDVWQGAMTAAKNFATMLGIKNVKSMISSDEISDAHFPDASVINIGGKEMSYGKVAYAKVREGIDRWKEVVWNTVRAEDTGLTINGVKQVFLSPDYIPTFMHEYEHLLGGEHPSTDLVLNPDLEGRNYGAINVNSPYNVNDSILTYGSPDYYGIGDVAFFQKQIRKIRSVSRATLNGPYKPRTPILGPAPTTPKSPTTTTTIPKTPTTTIPKPTPTTTIPKIPTTTTPTTTTTIPTTTTTIPRTPTPPRLPRPSAPRTPVICKTIPVDVWIPGMPPEYKKGVPKVAKNPDADWPSQGYDKGKKRLWIRGREDVNKWSYWKKAPANEKQYKKFKKEMQEKYQAFQSVLYDSPGDPNAEQFNQDRFPVFGDKIPINNGLERVPGTMGKWVKRMVPTCDPTKIIPEIPETALMLPQFAKGGKVKRIAKTKPQFGIDDITDWIWKLKGTSKEVANVTKGGDAMPGSGLNNEATKTVIKTGDFLFKNTALGQGVKEFTAGMDQKRSLPSQLGHMILAGANVASLVSGASPEYGEPVLAPLGRAAEKKSKGFFGKIKSAIASPFGKIKRSAGIAIEKIKGKIPFTKTAKLNNFFKGILQDEELKNMLISGTDVKDILGQTAEETVKNGIPNWDDIKLGLFDELDQYISKADVTFEEWEQAGSPGTTGIFAQIRDAQRRARGLLPETPHETYLWWKEYTSSDKNGLDRFMKSLDFDLLKLMPKSKEVKNWSDKERATYELIWAIQNEIADHLKSLGFPSDEIMSIKNLMYELADQHYGITSLGAKDFGIDMGSKWMTDKFTPSASIWEGFIPKMIEMGYGARRPTPSLLKELFGVFGPRKVPNLINSAAKYERMSGPVINRLKELAMSFKVPIREFIATLAQHDGITPDQYIEGLTKSWKDGFKFFSGGKLPKFAKGGMMPYAAGGKTFGTSDHAIPAILHGGEYVINKRSVDKYGTQMLQNINQGIYKGSKQYKVGGYVSSIKTPEIPKYNIPMSGYAKIAGAGTGISSIQSETTHNYNFYVDNFIGETEWFNGMMKEYNMKVVPANQKQAGLESRVIKTYNGINRGM